MCKAQLLHVWQVWFSWSLAAITCFALQVGDKLSCVSVISSGVSALQLHVLQWVDSATLTERYVNCKQDERSEPNRPKHIVKLCSCKTTQGCYGRLREILRVLKSLVYWWIQLLMFNGKFSIVAPSWSWQTHRVLWGILKRTCTSPVWCWPLLLWSNPDLHTTINRVRKNRMKHALCCYGAAEQPLTMDLLRWMNWVWSNCAHTVQLLSYLTVFPKNFNTNLPVRCWGASSWPKLYWFELPISSSFWHLTSLSPEC